MNHKKKVRVRIAVFFAVAASLVLIAWNQKPGINDVSFQTPPHERGVVDHAGIIDELSANVIRQETAELEKLTGIMLAVFTVRTTGAYKPDVYAVRLFEAWNPEGAGDTEKVIIFLARDEGWLSVERSIGLEFIITDSFCDELLREKMLPLLNQANDEIGKKLARGELPDAGNNEYVGGAMLMGIKEIRAKLEEAWFEKAGALSATPKTDPTAEHPSPWRNRAIFLAVLAVIVAGAGIYFSFSSMRCPRCGSRLNIQTSVLCQTSAERHGLREITLKCFSCGYIKKKKQIVFPGSRSRRPRTRLKRKR